MTHRLGQQAAVIGGSMTGLMTARVLADHFDTVTVLERDYIDSQPALHKSIPQGNHLHGLLMGGLQVATSLYPGFIAQLEKHGAMRCRLGQSWFPPGRQSQTLSTTAGHGTPVRPHRRHSRSPACASRQTAYSADRAPARLRTPVLGPCFHS